MLGLQMDMLYSIAKIRIMYILINIEHQSMNWGWGHGTYDGYYLLGIFDPTTSPIQYDANVGDNGNAHSDNVKFTKNIKTLTWSAE